MIGLGSAALAAPALGTAPGIKAAGSALVGAEGVVRLAPECEDGVPLDDDVSSSCDGVGLFVFDFPEFKEGYRKVDTLLLLETMSDGAGELTERRNACVRTGVVGERIEAEAGEPFSPCSPGGACRLRGRGGKAAIRRLGLDTLLGGVASTSRMDSGDMGSDRGRARLTLSMLTLPSLSKLGMTLMILRIPAAGGGEDTLGAAA